MSKRRMREAEMSEPVQRWLSERGYTPYTEVNLIDIVGLCGESELIAVDLKVSLTQAVIYQAYRAQLRCDQVYCAVSTMPRMNSLNECMKFGLGVLNVKGETVRELLKPNPGVRVVSEPWKKQFLEIIKGMEPGGVAGLPVLKGSGPAQDVARRVTEFRKEHPSATWGELFHAVPNHYAHSKSMQGALTSRGLV